MQPLVDSISNLSPDNLEGCRFPDLVPVNSMPVRIDQYQSTVTQGRVARQCTVESTGLNREFTSSL